LLCNVDKVLSSGCVVESFVSCLNEWLFIE
jgi:hypothetical protein